MTLPATFQSPTRPGVLGSSSILPENLIGNPLGGGNLTSILVALIEPSFRLMPSTSTIAPMATRPRDWSILVSAVTLTFDLPTCHWPKNPSVVGRLMIGPITSAPLLSPSYIADAPLIGHEPSRNAATISNAANPFRAEIIVIVFTTVRFVVVSFRGESDTLTRTFSSANKNIGYQFRAGVYAIQRQASGKGFRSLSGRVE